MASIQAGILCDFAQVREGLLFVASGCLTRMYRESLPGPLNVMLALVVEIPHDEVDAVHELNIAVKQSSTASELGRVVTALQAGSSVREPGESLWVPVVADLRSGVVPEYGAYDVTMSVDGTPGPYLTFYVVDKL
ncbi:MAG: DUF6941 family protein [Acidimicrobiales bacterium]